MVIKNRPSDIRAEATGSPSIQDVTLVPSGTTMPSIVAVPKKIFGGTSPGAVGSELAVGQFGALDSAVGSGVGAFVGAGGVGADVGGSVGRATGTVVPAGMAVANVRVGTRSGVLLGFGVWVGSPDPPQLTTANIARPIARVDNNFIIELILVYFILSMNVWFPLPGGTIIMPEYRPGQSDCRHRRTVRPGENDKVT